MPIKSYTTPPRPVDPNQRKLIQSKRPYPIISCPHCGCKITDLLVALYLDELIALGKRLAQQVGRLRARVQRAHSKEQPNET
jgi:hypothetical protein